MCVMVFGSELAPVSLILYSSLPFLEVVLYTSCHGTVNKTPQTS